MTGILDAIEGFLRNPDHFSFVVNTITICVFLLAIKAVVGEKPEDE